MGTLAERLLGGHPGWLPRRGRARAATAPTAPATAALALVPSSRPVPALGECPDGERATLVSRDEERLVRVTLEVTGAARLAGQQADFVPDAAILSYQLHGRAWMADAQVYGSTSDGSREDAYFAHDPGDGDDVTDVWPGWLQLLAEQCHPGRPGGWPGSDPEGSYL